LSATGYSRSPRAAAVMIAFLIFIKNVFLSFKDND
jgi:hypothetical protein